MQNQQNSHDLQQGPFSLDPILPAAPLLDFIPETAALASPFTT